MAKPRALVSVTNKSGLEHFRTLVQAGWEIVSTGGTFRELGSKHSIEATPVEKVTGFPEMMDGRVKIIHPKTIGGIICDWDNPKHVSEALEHQIDRTHLVAVNLYNFREKPGIDQIDVGGPTAIRAAAKNFASAIVIVDPDDYEEVIRKILLGSLTWEDRARLAEKVFDHTGNYDLAIAQWFQSQRLNGYPELRKSTGKPTH